VTGDTYRTPDPGLAGDLWIPTLVTGWETKVSKHTNFILQGYASKSTVQRTKLDELSATKTQARSGCNGTTGDASSGSASPRMSPISTTRRTSASTCPSPGSSSARAVVSLRMKPDGFAGVPDHTARWNR